jgi:uncharacterized Zn finger protein
MSKIIKVSIQIDPQKWYTLNEIANKRFFRGYEAAQTVRRIVLSDRENKNMLQAVVEGKANGKRYGIKGENIINFIKVWEAGQYQI